MDDMERLKAVLRKNIREQRQRLNVSQLKLSTEAGLALSYTADIENGNKTPSLKSLCKIAKALRVQPHQLMMDPGERKGPDKYSRIAGLVNQLKAGMNDSLDRTLREISAILHDAD